jgi:hypothetical protein
VFELLGFRKEATLRNHVRDRYGNKHDLVVMANDLDTTAAADPDVALVPNPR